jgi:hypothetical protein
MKERFIRKLIQEQLAAILEMNPAASSRKAKEKNPENYCTNSKCLWRVKTNQGDKPCPKHMKEASKKEPSKEAPAEQPAKEEPKQVSAGEGDAGEQAKKLGLTHAGWGNYKDSSGKVVARSIDGQLVKIVRDAPEISDPYDDKNAPKLGHDKAQKVPLDAIVGKDAAKKADKKVPSDAQKAASSTGGAGTFKGHELKDKLEFPDLSKDEQFLKSVAKTTEDMVKKYGAEGAVKKAVEAKKKADTRFEMLGKHNTNMTASKKALMDGAKRISTMMGMIMKSLTGGPNGKGTPKGNTHDSTVTHHPNFESAALATDLKLLQIAIDKHGPDALRKKLKNDESSNEKSRRYGAFKWAAVLDAVENKVPPLDPEQEQAAVDLLHQTGTTKVVPQGGGGPHISPGWNKAQDAEVEFDANAEETVAKLIDMFHGDLKKLLGWLTKKMLQESPAGKKRISQYLKLVTEELAGGPDKIVTA